MKSPAVASPARRPARDAELVEQLQLAPELGTGDYAAQKLAIPGDGAGDLLRRFIQKFQPEVAHAQRDQPSGVFGTGLRLRGLDGGGPGGRGVRREAVAGDPVHVTHAVRRELGRRAAGQVADRWNMYRGRG